MATGRPDWTNRIAGQTFDNRTIAGQLKAFTWYLDTFDSPVLSWMWAGSSVGILAATRATACLANYNFTGTGCCKLSTYSGLAGTLLKYIPVPPLNTNIGISSMWRFDDNANFYASSDGMKPLEMTVYGTSSSTARLHYNPDTGEWSITNGTTPDVTVVATKTVPDMFDMFTKLVFNVSTGKYVRLFINTYEVDLSTYDLYTYAAPAYAGGYIKFNSLAAAGKVGTLYIDNFEVTVNEPS